jgi:CRP-like cAMP-binding protein
MTEPVTLAELRSVDLFDGIDDEQLAEWVAVARRRDVAAGELIVEEQDHVPGLILLLEGTALTQMGSRGQPEPVGRQIAPTWLGAISVLTEDPLPVRIVADSPCRLAIVESSEFLRLLFAQQVVHQTVIRRIAPVLQALGGIEQNRERLASLGTMAAGLAHELNNPAAAARRAASQMAEEVGVVQSTLVKFVKSGVERADAEKLVELQQEALAHAAAATAMDTLDAADAEDELLELL